ncbi:Integrin beta-1 [Nibea albiflora]|uniref:Integrin beta-1 n=1 Tax=Nibea albiflora TaxID=240163 RepID=A0ACB7F5M3_NIBAL|nr:Integrin beta-1 [Nibea albiflora]
MDLKLLLISTLLGVFCYSNAQKEGNECINANARYCGECIQAGAKCGWCKDPVCELKLSPIITAEKCWLMQLRCH